MVYGLMETRVEAGVVGVVTLNRPKQMNALNDTLMDELGHSCRGLADLAVHRFYGVTVLLFDA
jgi:enoyl-CoA hydratase